MLGDHLKSTSALVARNGVLNVKYFYYPYGARRGIPFNTITAKHFTGQYHETALPGGEGLSFYNARWYDPKLGAFLSADSIVPNPGDPQSFNRYAYAGGNPLRFSDPSGHTKLCGAACEDEYKWSPVTKKKGGGTGGGVNYAGGGGGRSYFGNVQRQHRVSMWSYWSSSQRGDDLVSDWLNERGGTMRVYGPQAAMTQDLMRDEGVQSARVAYSRKPAKDFSYPYRFNQPVQPIREELQYRLGLDASGVGRVLGGYTVYIQAVGAEQGTSELLFVVYNVMGRESGTRLLGRGPSIESYLFGERPSNPQTVHDWWPRSIFENRFRQETRFNVIPPRLSGWGGSITTIFVWSEPLQVVSEQ
jgi:RHS repeat-associated protein